MSIGKKKRGVLILSVLLCLYLLSAAGCSMLTEESVKLKDIGFTVVSDEKVPAELMTLIQEKKTAPFQLTYSADEYLYIVIGYGQQSTGGYSIAVDNLYLTEDAIYVKTTLLGPQESQSNTPSHPYIVLKIDYMERPVIFE